MKVFLGVILAVIIGALVYQLVKPKEPSFEVASKLKNMAANPAAQATASNASAALHNVKVEEVIQTSSYTYLKVSENLVESWLAVVKQDIAVGSNYSYGQALEMNNFTSKELGRTFPVIYFVSETGDPSMGQPATTMPPTTMGRPKVDLKTDIVVPQSAGGISVAELYKNRSNYANKKVRVKGKVVKINNEVMDKNWVHIQDGTNDSGNFDLTVTTHEFVKMDDIVEFEGTIALNKDFGAGYFYELIMEGGTLRK
ncbi:MAG: GW dipeptide domain-containing protein [Bacteroidales bacterium]|jgi:hypothetical protein